MQSRRQLVNLALIGFMGTGKTSVGRLVAEQLRFEFLDTDELIQAHTGRTIADIFAHDGEPAFRALERKVVEEISARKPRPSFPPAAACRRMRKIWRR